MTNFGISAFNNKFSPPDLEKLDKKALKELAKEMGLKVSGSSDALKARIKSAS